LLRDAKDAVDVDRTEQEHPVSGLAAHESRFGAAVEVEHRERTLVHALRAHDHVLVDHGHREERQHADDRPHLQ
jgi:hypothetical protein